MPAAAVEVGDETHVPRLVLARQDDTAGHLGLRFARDLDLAELDAVPANLDLVVGAAEALEHPVGAPATEIAGAVPACAGRRRTGRRTKRSRRQPRPIQVAERHPGAADEELARHADR